MYDFYMSSGISQQLKTTFCKSRTFFLVHPVDCKGLCDLTLTIESRENSVRYIVSYVGQTTCLRRTVLVDKFQLEEFSGFTIQVGGINNCEVTSNGWGRMRIMFWLGS